MSIFLKKRNALKGFTLAELLMALAVLGLISALTLPSVWVSMQKSKNRALLTTTIKTLSDATSKIFTELPILPSWGNNSTLHLYDTYLNSAESNFIESGNANNSLTLPGGVVMNNFNGTGVGFVGIGNGVETILLDANGSASPNQVGKDRLWLSACFNPRGTCPAATYTVGGIAQEAGTVGACPDAHYGTGNEAFYNTLTQGS